jgi:hypothetical protein
MRLRETLGKVLRAAFGVLCHASVPGWPFHRELDLGVVARLYEDCGRAG